MPSNDQRSALLVMDMQSAILSNLPGSPIVASVAKAISHARSTGIPVIYVVVGFRPGLPEVSSNNKGFGPRKAQMATANMEEWMKIHPDVAPQQNEVTCIKRRVSAFAGSDLEVVLRAMEIQHIILTGVATSGVVLSTTREAADKDYRITIISDCCADTDEEVHRVLTTKVFLRQADVVTLEEWQRS